MSALTEKARHAVIRVLLVLATTASIMGFNFTGWPFFVALPFLAGVVMGVLIRTAPDVDDQGVFNRTKIRKSSLRQLIVSCFILNGFIIVASVRNWGTADVIGFAVMEAQLIILALLAYALYRRTLKEVQGAGAGCETSCEAMKKATRIHPDQDAGKS